jgi:serine/threonine-protein kinase
VVPIHNFGEIDGRLYVDMRLIEGRDLQSVLSEGALHPARAVMVIEQVAAALNAAHRVGLVHRDVKPSNILVAEFDFAYLIDFGIARTAGETGLTNTGSMIGTWAYMAPERFSTGHTDPRSDTYALACVLHECLTGRQPYPGDSAERQIAAHLMTPPPRPSSTQQGVPPGFDKVIATGMAKEPQQRYATTIELARAARAAITTPISRPPPMHRPEPPTPSSLPSQPTINRPPSTPPPTRSPSPSAAAAPGDITRRAPDTPVSHNVIRVGAPRSCSPRPASSLSLWP